MHKETKQKEWLAYKNTELKKCLVRLKNNISCIQTTFFFSMIKYQLWAGFLPIW